VKEFVETSGIPYIAMSMAKGLLPDDHPQYAGAARSLVLKESDCVMLVGARLNWLLSHGKGKQWGEPHSKKFIQIDIDPKEMDSNQPIDAPLVGDIESVLSMMVKGMEGWKKPSDEWTGAVRDKAAANVEKMSGKLMSNAVPMDFHGALGRLKRIFADHPDAMLVNEGANTLDFARSVIDMYKPRKRLDVGTWGVMGIGMGTRGGCCRRDRPARGVRRRRQRLRLLRHGDRDHLPLQLPVCVVIFNNSGIYRGTDTDPTGRDPGTTVFVPEAKYDLMMEAFGGVGVTARSPDDLERAVREAIASGKPTLVNAIIDPQAGTESGRIGNLNPQSVVGLKK
jgi:oxalyl-CoA decarboxylase